jgi:hypothetical protein
MYRRIQPTITTLYQQQPIINRKIPAERQSP